MKLRKALTSGPKVPPNFDILLIINLNTNCRIFGEMDAHALSIINITRMAKLRILEFSLAKFSIMSAVDRAVVAQGRVEFTAGV